MNTMRIIWKYKEDNIIVMETSEYNAGDIITINNIIKCKDILMKKQNMW